MNPPFSLPLKNSHLYGVLQELTFTVYFSVVPIASEFSTTYLQNDSLHKLQNIFTKFTETLHFLNLSSATPVLAPYKSLALR